VQIVDLHEGRVASWVNTPIAAPQSVTLSVGELVGMHNREEEKKAEFRTSRRHLANLIHCINDFARS
jgi:hypothetical protein